MNAITLCDPEAYSFDAETHTYRNATGREVDSVTTIIGLHWPINRSFYKSANTNRGTDMHELTASLERGDIQIVDVPPKYKQAAAAWMEFVKTARWKPIAIEEKFVTAQYAGTIDRIYETSKGLLLCDMKTGAPAKWHEIQLAAYSHAVEQLTGTSIDFHAVAHLDMDACRVRLKTHDPIERAKMCWEGLLTWRSFRGK